MMILSMAFPNILGLIILSPEVKRDLSLYLCEIKKEKKWIFNRVYSYKSEVSCMNRACELNKVDVRQKWKAMREPTKGSSRK